MSTKMCLTKSEINLIEDIKHSGKEEQTTSSSSTVHVQVFHSAQSVNTNHTTDKLLSHTEGTHLVVVFVDVLVQLVQCHQVVQLPRVVLKHKAIRSHVLCVCVWVCVFCARTRDSSARAEFISWSLAEMVCLMSAQYLQ